jgi:hypothetical protein
LPATKPNLENRKPNAMKNRHVIANSLLWAAAALAAAWLDAPPFLSQILLPCLAAGVLIGDRGSARTLCRSAQS